MNARRKLSHRKREMMASDTKRLDSGMKRAESPDVKKKRAEIYRAEREQINLHYSPEKTLSYSPTKSSEYPFSRKGDGAGGTIYGSGEWNSKVNKCVVSGVVHQEHSQDAVNKAAITIDKAKDKIHEK